VTAFADHVCTLLGDESRARELGEAARQFVVDNYNWEVVFRHLDTILAKCTESGQPTTRSG